MSADPVIQPEKRAQDPIELLALLEELSREPIRAEYVEGWVIVPPQPDYHHGKGAYGLSVQLTRAGFELAGMGMGFRIAADGRTRSLVVPDFYVLQREPTDLDEAYLKAHKGWYPSDLLALAGEVTSSNHETDTELRYRSYAAAGVPVHLIVHRQLKQVRVHTDPSPAECRYLGTEVFDLGAAVPLPAPYPELDTKPLVS